MSEDLRTAMLQSIEAQIKSYREQLANLERWKVLAEQLGGVPFSGVMNIYGTGATFYPRNAGGAQALAATLAAEFGIAFKKQFDASRGQYIYEGWSKRLVDGREHLDFCYQVQGKPRADCTLRRVTVAREEWAIDCGETEGAA